MTVPAVIYAAKSTADPRGSIPTQLADARAAALAEGREIAAEHHDEAASAFKCNRGQGLTDAKDAAIRLAAERGSAELWVQHSDRLARGDGITADHLAEVWFALRRGGVRLRSVQDDSNLEDAIRVVLIGERNHEDSKRKSESVKSGMARRAERGQYNGGRPTYGYRFDGAKGDYALVIVAAEAVIVVRIFEAFVAGRSLGSIARDLNRDGVRTQRGDEWRQGTITKMLANPMYVGRLRFNGEVVNGSHPPILSEELWNRAATLRMANTATPGKGRGRPPLATFVLQRLLRCGLCGGPMVARTMRKHGRVYAYYECDRRRRLGSEACEQNSVRRERIDNAIIDYFNEAVLDREATVREIEASARREVGETRQLREQAERDEQSALDSLARVKRDYMRGDLDAADWRSFRDELSAEIKATRAKVAQLTEHEQSLTRESVRDAQAELLEQLAAIRRAIIEEVRSGSGLDAVRAALTRTFSYFTLVRDPLFGSIELEPTIREGCIAGYTTEGPLGQCGAYPMRTALGVAPETNTPSAGRPCGRS
jgi:DNA invertase Pin-like site-specific DNA recombinase